MIRALRTPTVVGALALMAGVAALAQPAAEATGGAVAILLDRTGAPESFELARNSASAIVQALAGEGAQPGPAWALVAFAGDDVQLLADFGSGGEAASTEAWQQLIAAPPDDGAADPLSPIVRALALTLLEAGRAGRLAGLRVALISVGGGDAPPPAYTAGDNALQRLKRVLAGLALPRTVTGDDAATPAGATPRPLGEPGESLEQTLDRLQEMASAGGQGVRVGVLALGVAQGSPAWATLRSIAQSGGGDYVPIAAASDLAGAAATLLGPPAEEGDGVTSEIVICREIVEGQPAGVATHFDSANVLWGWFRIEGLPTQTYARAQWLWEGQQVYAFTLPLKAQTSTGRMSLDMTARGGIWSGSWELRVSTPDAVLASAQFTVGEAAQAQPGAETGQEAPAGETPPAQAPEPDFAAPGYALVIGTDVVEGAAVGAADSFEGVGRVVALLTMPAAAEPTTYRSAWSRDGAHVWSQEWTGAGAASMTFELSQPGGTLAPGEYRLEVTADDEAVAATSFTIR